MRGAAPPPPIVLANVTAGASEKPPQSCPHPQNILILMIVRRAFPLIPDDRIVIVDQDQFVDACAMTRRPSREKSRA